MRTPPSITCPDCGRTSYHPEDVRHRYCGYCKWFICDGPNPNLPKPPERRP